MKKARIEIHKILDPMWKPDKNKRRKIYSALSEFLGRKYHTADLRSIEEAREIYRQILKLKKNNFLENHCMLNEKYPRLASWGDNSLVSHTHKHVVLRASITRSAD